MTTADTEDQYEYETQARASVASAADDQRFEIESYGITDKESQRVVSVKLSGATDDRPLLHKALAIAFSQHGYTLESIQVTAKAIKDMAQIRLPM